MSEPVTRERLAQWGVAIFGDQWKAPLAREAEVSLRTMFRWASGEKNIRINEQELRTIFNRVKARKSEEAKTMKRPEGV